MWLDTTDLHLCSNYPLPKTSFQMSHLPCFLRKRDLFIRIEVFVGNFFKKNLALRFLDSFDSDIVFLDISMYTSLQSFKKTMMGYSPITDHSVHCSRWWLLLWACDGALEELVNISSCESFKCSKVYITISILIK